MAGCSRLTVQAKTPYIIFAAKQLSPLWMKNEVPISCYAVSDNGWIDQELFHFWPTDYFLKYSLSAWPPLLLLVGHSSHFKPENMRFSKDNGIVVFYLLPSLHMNASTVAFLVH